MPQLELGLLPFDTIALCACMIMPEDHQKSIKTARKNKPTEKQESVEKERNHGQIYFSTPSSKALDCRAKAKAKCQRN